MYCVYLLKSEKNKSLYIGCTNDIKRRFWEHNNEKSAYTKKFIPWKIIYLECFISKIDAFNREKSLKYHAQGLRRLKERLRDSLK